MNLKALSAAVAAASMVAFGCSQQTSTGSTDTADAGNDALGAATVEAADGRTIKESIFRYYALNVLRKPVEQLTPQEREAVIENLVSLDILAQAALDRGLQNERTIAVELELQRQQLLARSMINRFLEAPTLSPSWLIFISCPIRSRSPLASALLNCSARRHSARP